ncbi:MAG: hypothetical protein GXO32_08440 [Crenarchaeota archaeon]|nr:hypothetical protein [Thermoproteota archaeon]
MFQYVVPSSKARRVCEELPCLWFPAALVRMPQCRGSDVFLIDCCLSTEIGNPFLRLILLKRMPKKFELSASPPMRAPVLPAKRCSESDIVSDLNFVGYSLSAGQTDKLDEIVVAFTKPKDLKIRVTTFPLLGIRKRTYVVPAHRILEASRRIALQTLEGVVKKLCVGTPRILPMEVRNVYVLGSIDPARRVVDLFIGKKVMPSVSHYAAISSIPKLEELVTQAIKGDTGGTG